MRTITVNEAQAYLKGAPGRRLRVETATGGRTIFYNGELDAFGMLYPRSQRRGHRFDWESLTLIHPPKQEMSADERSRRDVLKYKTKAASATFTNSFIRKCLAADPQKGVYANGLSTGVPIEGRIITLAAVGRSYPRVEEEFRAALHRMETGRDGTPYHSGRLRWRGYDLSLDLERRENGDICGFLSLEYKDCGNGYYYLLVNDDEFIGYDID